MFFGLIWLCYDYDTKVHFDQMINKSVIDLQSSSCANFKDNFILYDMLQFLLARIKNKQDFTIPTNSPPFTIFGFSGPAANYSICPGTQKILISSGLLGVLDQKFESVKWARKSAYD